MPSYIQNVRTTLVTMSFFRKAKGVAAFTQIRRCVLKFCQLDKNSKHTCRSGGSIVDNRLDYHSSGRKFDPLLLWSFRRDFKPRSHLRMTSLLVGHLTRVNSLKTHLHIRMLKGGKWGKISILTAYRHENLSYFWGCTKLEFY